MMGVSDGPSKFVDYSPPMTFSNTTTMHSSRMRTGRSLTVCRGGCFLLIMHSGRLPGLVLPSQDAVRQTTQEGGASFPACSEADFPGGASFLACSEADFPGGCFLPSMQ